MATLPILKDGIRELGLELSKEQLGQFQRFYEVLIDWSERVSLSAVRDEEGVQRRHFLESAALITLLDDQSMTLEDSSLIDIGSGAGIPGIPLKILVPSLRLTVVEVKQRKSEFLHALIEELDLTDITIVSKRAEETARDPQYREQFDFAVAKALAPLRTLAELTLPFVRMGGLVIAPKGRSTEDEVREARVALETLKGSLRGVEPLPLADPTQHVIFVDKVLPTPLRFPRRPGVPAKRPL